MFFSLLVLLLGDIGLFIISGLFGLIPTIVVSVILFPLLLFLMFGLFVAHPNEARVLQFFGRYVGTVRESGLRWLIPFYTKRRISVRVRNFETERSKVNDADGNPVEVAAVVAWRVVDTAKACFQVDDFVNFMRVQSEAAVRSMATQYPYDTTDEDVVSLRGATKVVTDQLESEIQGRLDQAGLEVLEARITHLAYAPKIASAMLQRQQAGAIVEAREKIVEGAVRMVQMTSTTFQNVALLNWMKSARLRWLVTCIWCFVRTKAHNPSSIRVRRIKRLADTSHLVAYIIRI